MTENTQLEAAVGKGHAASRETAESVPYYVRACLLGIPAYLIGVHLWTWVWNVGTFIGGHADFRRLYASGYMVRTGSASLLYDVGARFVVENKIVGPGASLGFDHPSYETLLYAPFSYFSYQTAYLVFLGFNLGILAICFWLLQPWMRNLQRIYRWLPVAMFLAFLPVCAALIQGQDSLLLLMLLAIALRCVETEREFLAGLILAIGFFKFQILLPIAGLFFLWKRWRFVAGFTVMACAAILASLMLVGVSQNLEFIRTLAGMSVHSGSAMERDKYFLIPTAMPNLRGLLFGILNGHSQNLWIQVLTVVLSIVVFVWIALYTRRRELGDGLLVAILAACLVSYHLLMHDVVVLLIPVLVTIDRFIFAERDGASEEKFKLRAASLLFAAPVLMAWFPDHFYLAVIPLLLLSFVLVRSGERNIAKPPATDLQIA